jgi:ATP-dependent DNA ligase
VHRAWASCWRSATLDGSPLEARRQRLAAFIPGSSVLLSEPLPGTVDQIERVVWRLGLEGVVAKRLREADSLPLVGHTNGPSRAH